MFYYYERFKSTLAQFIKFLFMLLGVVLLGGLIAGVFKVFVHPAEGERHSTTEVYVVNQHLPGATQDRFDEKALSAFEQDTTKEFMDGYKKSPAAIPISISAKSAYTFAGPVKLAVVNLSFSGGDYKGGVVSVLGIISETMIKVSCVDPHAQPASLTQGPCADAIEKSFGYRIPKISLR